MYFNKRISDPGSHQDVRWWKSAKCWWRRFVVGGVGIPSWRQCRLLMIFTLGLTSFLGSGLDADWRYAGKKCLHIELWQLGIGELESHCWLSPINWCGFTITLLFANCLKNVDEEMYWYVLKCVEMYWGGPEQQRLYCYAGLPTLLHWLGEAANGIYKMNVNGECPHFDS